MNKLMTIVAVTTLALAAGCKKDKGGGGGGGGGGGAAAPSGPLEMTAKALWDDYNSDKYKGMELLEHFKPGVKVTGTVKRTIGAEDTSMNYNIWLDVDGQKWLDVQFMAGEPGTDEARAKKVKDGDTVTATCNIGGAMDNFMLLVDCKL